MNSWQIAPIITGAICIFAVFSLLIYFFQSRHGTTMMIESASEEMVDGERTTWANAVLHVVQYWLQELAGEPVMASSPDASRSYVTVPTVEGHVQIQFDWRAQKTYIYYARHSIDEQCVESRSLTLRIKHGNVDEVKLGKFIADIHDNEDTIIRNKVMNSDAFKSFVQNILHTATEDQQEEVEKGGE